MLKLKINMEKSHLEIQYYSAKNSSKRIPLCFTFFGNKNRSDFIILPKNVRKDSSVNLEGCLIELFSSFSILLLDNF